MHCRAGADSDEHSPNNPGEAAEQEEDRGDGNLLPHPRPIKPAIEGVVTDTWPRVETGGTFKLQAEIQIVEAVDRPRAAMPQEPVAVRLPLRPIPTVVEPDRPDRSPPIPTAVPNHIRT